MSQDPARLLPGRTVNPDVIGPNGEPTYLIEALPVATGTRVHIVFEQADDRWRHGIFIATQGELRAEDAISPALTLWADTSPEETVLEVITSESPLVFYNIWDEGRHGGFDSQAYTSAMLREVLDDGWIRYHCQDFGLDADFTSLVFRVRTGRVH